MKAHGSNGEVAVAPDGGLSFILPVGTRVWFVPPPGGPREGVVRSVRTGPKGPIIGFEGIGPNDAAALAGTYVVVDADEVPEGLLPTEMDPVGLCVIDVERGELGSVTDVIVTGANDVWVVEGVLGEVLLPVIDDVIVSVDEETRTAHVRLLPGLIDDDGEV